MEKLRVDKNLYETLNKAYEKFGEVTLANMFFNKKIEGYGFVGELQPLNDVTPNEFILILKYGYELEKTKEDELAETYIFNLESAKTTLNINSQMELNSFNKGILYTLDVLDIKVKGINV